MEPLITQTINSLGYVGIAFLMALETFFPPIPSELIVPFAGFSAAKGTINIVGVIIAGTIGSVLGATGLYAVGHLVDSAKIRRFLTKYGKYIGLRLADLEKGEAWFTKYGKQSTAFGRMIPGIRSIVSLPAGIQRMNLGTFLVLTSLGTTAWVTLLGVAGYVLGNKYERISSAVDTLSTVIILAVVAAITYFFYLRLTKKK